MKPLIPQTMTAVSVMALALAVGGCSSSDKKDDMVVAPPEPTPQEMCEADGGRWEADMMKCTTAEELAAAEAARVAAATKAAGTKEAAIKAEAAQTDDDGPGGMDASDDHMVMIERNREMTKVTITVDGAAEDDPKFMQDMDLGPGTTRHTRTMEADTDGNVVEEVVVLTTDIEAPKSTAFAMVAGQELNARDLDENVDADGNNENKDDFTALNVEKGINDVNLPKIMSAAFSPGTAATLKFTWDNPTTTDKDEAFEAAGTYNGAMGTYRCNGIGQCEVTIDAMGKITDIKGDWVFTPDDGATSDVPDADYLHYGVWLKKTTDAMGAVTYNEVEAFSGSSIDASDGGDIAGVEGSASYSGGATGVYVKNVYATDGTIDTATSGDFTADVSLMAHFGGTSIPEDDHNMVTGTIDNFMLSGNKMNDWSVALMGTRADNANMVSGTVNTDGDDEYDDGAFDMTYHGSSATTDHDMDDTTPDINPPPHTVTGEFDASFSDGSVLGGFGARKDD